MNHDLTFETAAGIIGASIPPATASRSRSLRPRTCAWTRRFPSPPAHRPSIPSTPACLMPCCLFLMRTRRWFRTWPRNPPSPALRAQGHEREFRPATRGGQHPRPHLRTRCGRRNPGLRHGLTASSLISAKLLQFTSPVKVQVQGGDTLEVSFKQDNGDFSDVRLTGPADFTFEGKIEILSAAPFSPQKWAGQTTHFP